MTCTNPTEQQVHGGDKSADWLLWGSGSVIFVAYILQWQFTDQVRETVWLHDLTHSALELINTIWWGIVIGIVMISVLGRVPREFVMSALGTRSGTRGIVRATFAGVLLDLCNHGILMVGAKLYERGVSTGQVMAFLVSSPWNSFSLTIVLITLIGLPWTFAFIVMSMGIAIVTGIVFDQLVTKGVLPSNPHTSELPQEFRFWSEAKEGLGHLEITGSFVVSMLASGIRESRMVVRWILFGVLLASLVRAFVPPHIFETLFGPTLMGLGVTILVASVLEVCSEGSTPIAADILTHAGAPGNSFAFLMGGVATDYTEIMVLREATDSWRVALFLPLVTLPQIILLAWLINVLDP